MKRILFALVLVGALAGSAFASAATLPLAVGSVQEGQDLSLTCQSVPIKVEFNGLSTETGSTGIDYVTISDVQESCAGNSLTVRLDTTGGNLWGARYPQDAGTAYYGAGEHGWIDLVSGTSSYRVSFWGNSSVSGTRQIPQAQTITGIRMWLTGPNSIE